MAKLTKKKQNYTSKYWILSIPISPSHTMKKNSSFRTTPGMPLGQLVLSSLPKCCHGISSLMPGVPDVALNYVPG
ncbi:TPA: hypothetical protein ACNE3B_002795 [Escherichia coli]|uniref:hypothetical protein n=1 Tax=Escherichia coli TaxID=562 RepID=UPI0028E0A344|nr:hypothetical protein [Escherichia coli]